MLGTPTVSSQKGSAPLRVLVLLALGLSCGLYAVRVFAGPDLLSSAIAPSQTPGIIGQATGRATLEIDNTGTNNFACGPWNVPTANWWTIAPTDPPKMVGILVGGQFTASNLVGCVAANATPAVGQIWEEGNMPQRTDTPTASPASTDTRTPASTATVTATFATFTATATATATTVATSTKTTKPTATKTITLTPSATATSTATPK